MTQPQQPPAPQPDEPPQSRWQRYNRWQKAGIIAATAFAGLILLAMLIPAEDEDADQQARDEQPQEEQAAPGPDEQSEQQDAPETEPEPADEEPEPQQPADADPEQAYLDAVYQAARENGSGIHGFGDEWNLDLGYAVCDDLSGGMAPTEVVQGLNQSDSDSSVQPISKVSVEIVGNAQIYLCPDA